MPCWQQRLCTCMSKCWHTNTCIHTYPTAFHQKDCSPRSPQREKRKKKGCTALPQTGHAPLLQPQRQPALISKSALLQVLSIPSPHLWEHHPNSCTASWLHHLWGVSLGHPCPCTAPVTVPSATDKGQYLQSQDATREL